MSFGFKYGLPIGIVFDVRFLNPYYKNGTSDLTGQDPAVYDYVVDHLNQGFLSSQRSFLFCRYNREGKSVLTIAIGCTGGQHRSVAFAGRLAHDLEKNWQVNCSHRDKDRRKGNGE